MRAIAASSPWASEGVARATEAARFVVIGNPAGRRVELFQSALASLGLPPARVVAWADLLAERVHLADVVERGDVVRLESPGKDFDVERAILAGGAREADEEDPAGRIYDRASRRAVESLPFDKGLILYPRQWYLGFRAALRRIAADLVGCRSHRLMNEARDVEIMFDKQRCHALLSDGGVAVPPSIGPIRGFDDLLARMLAVGWRRVFVKLAHGSSASGVVAYQADGSGRQQAVTTVEMVHQAGELKLYNSRRLRTYTDSREIATLIDALARHRVHVERWLPKAGIDGRTFDLRVLVVAGRARHVVVRLSRSPLTNLHLLNDRADPACVSSRMGEAAWSAAMRECERAMACFSGSLHGGVDLMIAAGLRRHAVLEVNAFGDLLPGALWRGMGSYEAELVALTGRELPAPELREVAG
jgi:hypothetical protein